MDLHSVKTIKELLAKNGLKPNKTLGQNFLINKKMLDKIIEAADIGPNDTIIEIGPGLGTLTQELAKKAKKVIVIEKDPAMAAILTKNLAGYDNVEIVQGDALLTTHYQLLTHYKVVANLPYYITSPVIRMFLESENQPQTIVLMIQKEVAKRICAKPPDMSILAVSVQFYATPKITSYVSKECFWPVPKVDSAIIKITPHLLSPLRAEAKQSSEEFFRVVKAGFSHPRKQLANNMIKTLKIDRQKINAWLLKNNINPLQRAETLNIKDWEALTLSLDMLK